MNTTKPFQIPKQLVWEAWKLVKANAGSAGIDQQTLSDFERNLKDNLYKIWNRMSSGSYFPPPVKGVEIPKKTGGSRLLGVPACSDRVAQTVVKLQFEPIVEKVFLPDSYGYRPGRSAHGAIEVTRKRCWKYDWVLEFDIRGLFDEIRHDLVMKAVRHHTDKKWVILYLERWLKAPILMPDGKLKIRNKGTPQGGCVSPVISNLFLHYVFDKWMQRTFPETPWVRFADDGLCHCKSLHEAETLLSTLKARFKECGLEIHPTKTRIVYCQDDARRAVFPCTEFKFLGFLFKKREVRNRRTGSLFMGFGPAIGNDTLKEMRRIIKRDWKLGISTHKSFKDLAYEFNPIIRGWIQYYGAFHRSALKPLAKYLDGVLRKWARRKFKSLRIHKVRAVEWLKRVHENSPKLFAHWSVFAVY